MKHGSHGLYILDMHPSSLGIYNPLQHWLPYNVYKLWVDTRFVSTHACMHTHTHTHMYKHTPGRYMLCAALDLKYSWKDTLNLLSKTTQASALPMSSGMVSLILRVIPRTEYRKKWYDVMFYIEGTSYTDMTDCLLMKRVSPRINGDCLLLTTIWQHPVWLDWGCVSEELCLQHCSKYTIPLVLMYVYLLQITGS